MKILEAEERLARGCADNEVYDLVLAVTGSEERASEAYAERLMVRQKRDEVADI